MFDLNQAIAERRRDLMAHGVCDPGEADELGSHLREEHESLREAELSGDEAFVIALRRLGSPVALSQEFAKGDPGRAWGHRVRWMAAGVLAYLLVSRLAGTAGGVVACCYGLSTGQGGYALGTVNVIARIAMALGALGLLCHLATRDSWGISTRATRLLSTQKGRVVFVALATLLVMSARLASQAAAICNARLYGAQSLGAMSLVVACFGLAFSGVLPLVLALVIARTYRGDRRQVPSEAG